MANIRILLQQAPCCGRVSKFSMSPAGVAPVPGEEREGGDRIEDEENSGRKCHTARVMPLFL